MLDERAELRFPVLPFTLDARFLNLRFETLKNLPRQKGHLSIAATATWQAVEKRPSPAFPSSLVVATYGQVRLAPLDFGSLGSGRF